MAQTKQQKQLWFLVALLLVAASVWYFFFTGNKSGAGGISAVGNYTPINAQDFGAVFDLLSKARSTEYKTSDRNIFVTVPEPVEAAPPAAPSYQNTGPQPPPPPPPPPPAQLPMKFFGYGTLPSGGPRRAFLLDGDEVRIVGEGEIVLNHIRILRIGNDRLEFEDTNTGQRGSNSLEGGPAT
jgi:hypothetical protein